MLLRQILALQAQFGGFLAAFGHRTQLGNASVDLLEQRLQRRDGIVGIAFGLQGFFGQCLQRFGGVGVIERLAYLVQGVRCLLNLGDGRGLDIAIGRQLGRDGQTHAKLER